MEEDIQNYSPTIMFRRTSCTLDVGPVFRRLRLEVCVKTGLADRDIRDLVGFTNVLQGNLILQSINTQQQKYKQENCRRGIHGENNILKNRSRDCLINTADIVALKMTVRKLVSRKSTTNSVCFSKPKNPKHLFQVHFFCLILFLKNQIRKTQS